MKVSIVTPFFNEQRTLPRLLKELEKLSVPGVQFEILFVDDGSTDASKEVIMTGKKNLRHASAYISHKKNLGKGRAIKKGLESAKGEYILIQDADMEYHPRYIPKLLAPILSGGADVVYGTRLKRLPHFSKEERTLRFAFHYLGNRTLSLLTSILYGTWITDMETGYKLFPRKAISSRRLRSASFDIEPEITARLLRGGYRVVEVPIKTNPRSYKQGKKLRTLPDGIAALVATIRYRFFS